MKTFKEWWKTVINNQQLNVQKWDIEYAASAGFAAGFGAGYANELIAELRAEIAALKAVWLPLDQTVQCAVCGWHDWQTDEKHSDECPIGFMANKIAAKDAEIERLLAENQRLRDFLTEQLCEESYDEYLRRSMNQ